MFHYDDNRIISVSLAVTGLDSAAEVLEMYLPDGHRGRYLGASFYATTATTVGAVAVNIGDGTTATKYGVSSLAVTAINTASVVTNTAGSAEIPAGQKITVGQDGGSTAAGAGVLTLYFEVSK